MPYAEGGLKVVLVRIDGNPVALITWTRGHRPVSLAQLLTAAGKPFFDGTFHVQGSCARESGHEHDGSTHCPRQELLSPSPPACPSRNPTRPRPAQARTTEARNLSQSELRPLEQRWQQTSTTNCLHRSEHAHLVDLDCSERALVLPGQSTVHHSAEGLAGWEGPELLF